MDLDDDVDRKNTMSSFSVRLESLILSLFLSLSISINLKARQVSFAYSIFLIFKNKKLSNNRGKIISK